MKGEGLHASLNFLLRLGEAKRYRPAGPDITLGPTISTKILARWAREISKAITQSTCRNLGFFSNSLSQSKGNFLLESYTNPFNAAYCNNIIVFPSLISPLATISSACAKGSSSTSIFSGSWLTPPPSFTLCSLV